MQGLSLFVRCDEESSAIGCNAEPNEIKIILISVCPINVHWLVCLRCLRGGCLCLLGGCLCLLGIVHIAIACVGLVFEPTESIFIKLA